MVRSIMRSARIRLLVLAIAQPLLGGRCTQGFMTNNPLSIHHKSDGAINRACTIGMSTSSAERRVTRITTSLFMSDSSRNGDEDRVENGEAVSSSSNTMPSVSTPSAPMGPTLQPEEDKLREKMEKERLERMEPKENKWASGAFKRGVALQAVVLGLVIYLQLQPEEVGKLAICAPFTQGPGCVSFGKWVEVVFFGAPIPIF